MKCKKCKHEWTYKGKLQLSTCPSCGIKNKVNEDGNKKYKLKTLSEDIQTKEEE